MSILVDNTRQYLLNASDISKQEKEYAMNFCKKTEYLNNLRNTVINELHETVAFGYGDMNSKICFVFSSEESFDLIKPVLQILLESFKLNLWDVYVTFVNKTSTEYPSKYGYLINELYAIGSKILYVVDKTDKTYNDIHNYFSASNVPYPFEKAYNISIEDMCSTDSAVKKELLKMFKYLINYRN